MTAFQDFYNLVDPEDQQHILNVLLKNKAELAIKINDIHRRAKIIGKHGTNAFLISKLGVVNFKNERVSGSFELERKKYFFKTSLTTTPDGPTVQIPTELFQLQRRDNFRVTVPIGVPYRAEIQSINGKKTFVKVEIRDVSLGGCLIVFKKEKVEIEKKDELQLNIKMLDLDKELIVCTAKHVVMLADDTKVQIGLNFTDPEGDFLTDLQSLLIHLDRIHRGKKYE